MSYVRDGLYQVGVELANVGIDPLETDITVKLGFHQFETLLDDLRMMARYANMRVENTAELLLLCPGGFTVKVIRR